MQLKSLVGACLCLFSASLFAQEQFHWKLDNLTAIDGNKVTVYGEPAVTIFDTFQSDKSFEAIYFDGVDDGVIVDANPLAGATSFTAEVIFYLEDGGEGEQRFVHFQQDDDNRALIELRNFNTGEWYLDTFIKSGGTANEPLIDETNTHPTMTWQHAALIYDNGTMSHYVNGVKELEGPAQFIAMTDGKTSLGMRMNFRSYFKGYIREIRVTHAVLSPEDFLSIEPKQDTTVTDTSTVDSTDVVLNNSMYFDKGLIISPNPASDSQYIAIQLPVATKEALQLTVKDLSGMTVKVLEYLTVDSLQSVDIAGLSSGIYVIEVRATGEVWCAKWKKE